MDATFERAWINPYGEPPAGSDARVFKLSGVVPDTTGGDTDYILVSSLPEDAFGLPAETAVFLLDSNGVYVACELEVCVINGESQHDAAVERFLEIVKDSLDL